MKRTLPDPTGTPDPARSPEQPTSVLRRPHLGIIIGVGLLATVVAAAAFAVADTTHSSHSAFPVAAAPSSPTSVASSPTSPTTAGTTAPSGAAVVGATPAVCGQQQGAKVMADGMVMAPVPGRAPTATDQRAAQTLVADVAAGTAKYTQLSAALAAGYVPATNPRGYIVHYANWDTVRAGDALDANRPSSLVYANTVSGPLLIGAMFLGPGPCQPGPDVAGPLTQWHAHANLCLSATHEVVGKSDASGACAVGTHNTNTYFMMHVWTAPSLASSYQFAADVPRSAYAAIIRSGRP